MDSKDRHQLELLPSAEPHVEPVTPELIRSIRRRTTFLAAWNFAQDFAALEDKQCYQPLGIDSSHWTKIRRGLASPPADERFGRYMDVVRNEIPLVWLVESRGYDWSSLRPHRDDKDRRIAELEKELADEKRLNKRLADYQRGRG
jgi:hypothetical protein